METNKKDWNFERSSGYRGYRNKLTGEWLYEEDFFKLFAGGIKQTAEEKFYTKEDLEEAHQMGAIFAYGRKSATREERLEHFNNWLNENN